MISTLNVLSVGSPAWAETIRDVLLVRTKCKLFISESVRDLVAIPRSTMLDVAIFHNSLSTGQLRSCAETVRRDWPMARILLLHSHPEILDDPMYDEQISPHTGTNELLANIELLAAFARRRRRRLELSSATAGQRMERLA